MTRKSMSRQTVSRMSVRHKKRQSVVASPTGEDEMRPPPLIPPIVRHFEAALVLLVWIGFLPAAMYLTSTHKAIVCTLALAVVLGMLLHSFFQRPYFTECDDVELDFEERSSLTKHTQEEHVLVFEEWRLVFFLLLLLSSVGAAIGIGMGGDTVYHVLRTPGTSKCSVIDLADLQTSYEKVWCQDGFVDVSQQVSFYTKKGIMTSAYSIYRMAPVYSDSKRANASSDRGAPVAWAITKDHHMAPAPCADGLCGLMLDFKEGVFVSDVDRGIYGKLKNTLYDELKKNVDNSDETLYALRKFSKESVPAILLTDPSNPQGLAGYFVVGIVSYAVTLLGIICLQFQMFCEPSKKSEGASYNLLDRESLGHPFVGSAE